MPVYDYSCKACGVFTASRPMSEYKAPIACPSCGAEAVRVLLTAPGIAGMDGVARTAMAKSESSASAQKPAGHGAGCACCHAPIRKVAAGG